ncbi:MAG: hypothetical protein KME29_04775 [Calothrix sp. FI2-JRJ7]|jgi:hypothetical protein|nr:hypothetical protein [Calothrix sp. FI2-JRJ7]
MPTNLKFRSWLEYEIEAIFTNSSSAPRTLPDRANFYALLCNGNITDVSSKASVIAAEIEKTTTNNYNRFNAPFATEAIYDGANKRWQMPVVTWTVSYPEAVQYNSVVLIADSRAESNKPVVITPGTPATFTTSDAHGLSQDEELMITPGISGTAPTGLDASVIYYMFASLSSTEFQISALPPGDPNRVALDLSAAGSSLQLRYARGRLVGYRREDSIETLAANAPRSFNFFIANAAGFGVGAGT